jgi:hypothetical protein
VGGGGGSPKFIAKESSVNSKNDSQKNKDMKVATKGNAAFYLIIEHKSVL